jgi:hypothetical protein
MIESFEKIPVKIFPTANDGSIMVAAQIATLIKDKQAKRKLCAWNGHWKYPYFIIQGTSSITQGRRVKF